MHKGDSFICPCDLVTSHRNDFNPFSAHLESYYSFIMCFCLALQKVRSTVNLSKSSNNQIGFASSDAWQQSVSDEEFIQRASEFIISQKLTEQKCINCKRLAMSVDAEALKSFVLGIIDNIVVRDGMIRTILFKNVLSHTFIFQDQ